MSSEVKQTIDRFVDNFLVYMLNNCKPDFVIQESKKLLKVFRQKHTKDTIINIFHLMLQPQDEQADFKPILLQKYKVKLERGFGMPISIDEQLEILQLVDEVEINRFCQAFAKQLEVRIKQIK